jgi:hypothetical protein
MRLKTIRHEFVEFIPKDLEGGVLYISIPYNTAVHRCACGCGSKITTPLGPARWRFTYDGETVSLAPSVGNWSYPCQSHYWLKHGRIKWSAKWSPEKIEAGRARDRAARQRYHTRGTGSTALEKDPAEPEATLGRLRRWAQSLFKR